MKRPGEVLAELLAAVDLMIDVQAIRSRRLSYLRSRKPLGGWPRRTIDLQSALRLSRESPGWRLAEGWSKATLSPSVESQPSSARLHNMPSDISLR